MSANRVVIGLGSNLQNPIHQLRHALFELKQIPGISVRKVSAIYESMAQVPSDAPTSWNQNFLNAAALIEVDHCEPLRLLKTLKSIELKMGRTSSETWAPRVMDLDILYWQGLQIELDNLKIPHAHLRERPFALLPLLDVLPETTVNRPLWAVDWILKKPFETRKSDTFFWPKLMGIVNLTTDSFSDGNEKLNEAQIMKLVEQGAEIIDFGAESTRPGALSVSESDEWHRLKHALELISGKGISVSIDSYKPSVIEKCLENFEIDFINDVTGLRDQKMKELVKASGKKAIVMHSLSVPPKTDEFLSEVRSPTEILTAWWHQKKSECVDFGISESQLIFDMGIGFGKSKQQNHYLLKHLNEFSSVTDEILVGHSRKSYQTLFSDRSANHRDLETALSTATMNLAFVQYLRIHDLESQRIALRFMP
ncbi:MAG: hypothetical protein A2622_11635 [Bdellovibrionales bacterium RIFCSPHIGHO2_01_FULL_40_29]|nr:MAG: hypothetical protein A2622_11635 [Bdellovibrionales bacterium RIFCSPHIGHO2_01_FULL_40_29]OFZ35258.1 MAG: hypothetical protein A3D17_08630 [Bdellovibrionales bacterium RIFCSPHIGHO2_02_FULL_40_15]